MLISLHVTEQQNHSSKNLDLKTANKTGWSLSSDWPDSVKKDYNTESCCISILFSVPKPTTEIKG